MFIRIVLNFGILSLLGCATARPMVGPDGTTHQLISCPSINLCYEKAREVCAGPYKIINSSTEIGPIGDSATSTQKLLIKCGG